jgi:hypothetical protein
VVERTLAWITRHRRTVRDYERLPAHHETYIYWSMIIVMTRRLAAWRGSPPGPGARWSRPLMITQASPDTAEFSTDRGRREFPAWRLGGQEVDGTFWALDPAIAATRWQPPEPATPKPFDGLPHGQRQQY